MIQTGASGPHSARVQRNQDQVRFAEHLIGVARNRLTGRDEQGQQLEDRRPREQVVLGVLSPQPRQSTTTPPATSPSGTPFEPGVPVDRLPASEMGLTALVSACAETLVLKVSARYAIYLQHLPTHGQQAERSGLSSADDPEVSPGDTDDDIAQADSELDARANGIGVNLPGLIAPTTPGEDQLVDLPPDVAAAVIASVAGVQAGSPGSDSAVANAAGAGARDQLRLIYRRYEITVEHALEVPVPTDARPHTYGERSAYDTKHAEIVRTASFPPSGAPGGLFVPMAGRSATRIPRQAVIEGEESYAAYLHANKRATWATPLPKVAFQATVQRTPDKSIRLAVTLVNESPDPARDKGFTPEVSLYDAGFSVAIGNGTVIPSEYRVVERDYRKEPRVWAHGRFCCLDEAAFHADGRLTTTTMPIYRQQVYESRPELQPSFSELATDPLPPLRHLLDHMIGFLRDWDDYLRSGPTLPPTALTACAADRDAFADEVRRFTRGLELIANDIAKGGRGIGGAFIRANEAFALFNTREGLNQLGESTTTTWRLFQIIYVVCNLPALVAREAPLADKEAWINGRGEPRQILSDLDELDVADVLWFPTGGGKSAALYGIVAVALFFDRLRGKHSGVTSMIRFPLRMLSVQQLERVLRLIASCEKVRRNRADPGEEFRLGYWVGSANTPNKITSPADERWRDVAAMSRQGEEWRRANTVIPTCPFCASSSVVLEPDPVAVVVRHRCRTCGEALPVDISDDEVFRHLPSVVVCTVDKIASLAFNAHVSHLTHGPTHRCPDHGYITYPQGRAGRCLARQFCNRERTEWEEIAIKDPAPALVIQDELHLLSEELGTFAAHYETLWQHLCVVGSGLPSKILAATATISDYANQVTQLYALRPRRFPTDGWEDGQSFYARQHDDLVRRVFVGTLPTQMDTLDVSLATGFAIRDEIGRLRNSDPVDAVSLLGLQDINPDEITEFLFRYELQGYYCNRKTDADRVQAANERHAALRPPGFGSVRLNGQNKLGEISDAIRRVERETASSDVSERLAGIAGTSLISHGVDLERLNLLFVLGMPSTVAYYVQASSRAGRTDVGIVFTALGRNYVRDRSVFHFFQPQHEHVNVLVEPVALNRFSTHGPLKTVSGLIAAIIIQQWGRDTSALGPAAAGGPQDLTRADQARQLLARMRAHAAAGTGPDPIRLLRHALRAAYGLTAPVLDRHMAQRFADDVDHLASARVESIEAGHEMLLSRSLRPRPPRSLRDVDTSADFGAVNYPARRRFQFLGGTAATNDDVVISDEEEG
ncbi:helicase-related protein [Pseudofrankia sp. BMG5.37]|uniref:helicase-related protein n=1 Tax=Pseudofrankia sp. BMG5.37 TaxID=3050035 RepID=UPI00289592BA|nr:helicase-related protein [Pseudofrankia sp. BMG5.37]MDT3438736.1 hypothetical protein [Pseudofrankia sp. BMG5.37]